ncbi:MAG TPA: hypothetical protein VGS10_04295 [Terracidiphilus sp.]|nr:hypothetical protein [Terracidiphilus sp.]
MFAPQYARWLPSPFAARAIKKARFPARLLQEFSLFSLSNSRIANQPRATGHFSKIILGIIYLPHVASYCILPDMEKRIWEQKESKWPIIRLVAAICLALAIMYEFTSGAKLYFLTLWEHVSTLLAGCGATVVLGILQKYVFKKPLSLKWELTILAAFIFFATFQAWRDKTVVQQERTYIQLNGAGGVSAVQFKAGFRPFIDIQEVNGDFVARGFAQAAKMELVDLPYPHALKDPWVAREVEDKAFKNFKAHLMQEKPFAEDVAPHNAFYLEGMLDHGLTDSEVKALLHGDKVLMFLGFIVWSDSAGQHGQELCYFVNALVGGKLVTPSCLVHTGYIDRVAVPETHE